LECLKKEGDRKFKFMEKILKGSNLDAGSIIKSLAGPKAREEERQRRIKKGLPVDNEAPNADT